MTVGMYTHGSVVSRYIKLTFNTKLYLFQTSLLQDVFRNVSVVKIFKEPIQVGAMNSYGTKNDETIIKIHFWKLKYSVFNMHMHVRIENTLWIWSSPIFGGFSSSHSITSSSSNTTKWHSLSPFYNNIVRMEQVSVYINIL